MSTLQVIRLPSPVSYAVAYERQRSEADALIADRARVAKLLLLQHAPVYTLGRTTKPEHLEQIESTTETRRHREGQEFRIQNSEVLRASPPCRRPVAAGVPPWLNSIELLREATGADVVEADRGGSVTYHGPGQLTAYLILNLKAWDFDIRKHLWILEEAAIRTLAAFGLKGDRVEGMTGVWISDFRFSISDSSYCKPLESAAISVSGSKIENCKSKISKVCAIGVGCRRWVTYHGLSLNVDLDLAPFERIDPCGLGRRPVTSLAKHLGRKVAMHETEEALVKAIAEVLEAPVVPEGA